LDLDYGGELEAFREEVRAFLGDHWPLRGKEADLPRSKAVAVFRERAVERGYLYRSIPKLYGGSEQEPDVLRAQVIRDEFSAVRAPQEDARMGTAMVVPTLLEHGSEWQKEKFIRPTLSGEITWCQGYSEPGSGSDLASLKTRGELVDGEWVINGQKVWTSDAHQADFMFCLVRTEPEAPKHAGISYLLIDMKQSGIDVRPLRMMSGISDFNEVFLNDVRTPADWIVGKRGEGWNVSRTTLKHERNLVGSSRRTLESLGRLVQLAREAQIDGRPAIEDESVRQRLAELEGYVWAHQCSGLRQLTASAKGEDAGLLTVMAKLYATEIAHEISRIAIDLIGDDALLAPAELGLFGRPKDHAGWVANYFSSLGLAIAGGTSNIQRNVIAERGLGLPRDRAADRGSDR
jgi:alkylation response protein AidB-like acyl-CoA dehydrogenase